MGPRSIELVTGVYYNEWEPYCQQWLKNLMAAGHLPQGEVDGRDIRTVQPDDVRGFSECHFFAGIGGWPLALKWAGWEGPVWTGSCPCQPFSGAGKRTGINDERHLWPVFRNLISERKPPVVFGEQVASPAGRNWLSSVRTDLEVLGYAVGASDLCAASIGSPQIRQRLWWVADADYPRRQGAVRKRESNTPRAKRLPPCGEPVRSTCGCWPPGPSEVNNIQVLANGIPGVMGACKGYGNAIVPAVAQVFIEAVMECRP